jgi:hypothetical protein
MTSLTRKVAVRMSANPLFNLGDLASPANLLIEKVSDAVGAVWHVCQAERLARIDNKIAKQRAEAQIEIDTICNRAAKRLLKEEERRQANMEKVLAGALPQVEESATPGKMDEDWVANFFEKCRNVSNDQMQSLWSRLLAGEANSPGAVSRHTINLIADLDSRDAQLFATLCRFAWKTTRDECRDPLVYDATHPVYLSAGISQESLRHLETLGLVYFDGITGFVQRGVPSSFEMLYFGRSLQIQCNHGPVCELPCGMVMFSRAGRELFRVVEVQAVPGVYDLVANHLVDPMIDAFISVRRDDGIAG